MGFGILQVRSGLFYSELISPMEQIGDHVVGINRDLTRSVTTIEE